MIYLIRITNKIIGLMSKNIIFKTKNCKNCPVKDLWTKAKYQRIIERHEFAEALEKNKQNSIKNPEIYAQRQSIVEHPFGTTKRQCDVLSLSK